MMSVAGKISKTNSSRENTYFFLRICRLNAAVTGIYFYTGFANVEDAVRKPFWL